MNLYATLRSEAQVVRLLQEFQQRVAEDLVLRQWLSDEITKRFIGFSVLLHGVSEKLREQSLDPEMKTLLVAGLSELLADQSMLHWFEGQGMEIHRDLLRDQHRSIIDITDP